MARVANSQQSSSDKNSFVPFAIAVLILFLIVFTNWHEQPKPIVQPIPVKVSELRPFNGATITGEQTVLRFKTSTRAHSALWWREKGHSSWTKINSSKEELEHGFSVAPLEVGALYEWQGRAKTLVNGLPHWVSSKVQLFKVAKGLVFGKNSYSFTIERDYAQRRTIRIRNNDDRSHKLLVGIENEHDDLIVDFIGSGSRDKSIDVPAKGEVAVDLLFHGQDTKLVEYDILAKIESVDEQSKSELTVPIHLKVHDVNFDVQVVEGPINPVTLARTITLKNRGDQLTDLTIEAIDGLAGAVTFQPQFHHARLSKKEELSLVATPVLEMGMKKLAGPLRLAAAGKSKTVRLEFKVPEGKAVFCGTTYGASDEYLTPAEERRTNGDFTNHYFNQTHYRLQRGKKWTANLAIAKFHVHRAKKDEKYELYETGTDLLAFFGEARELFVVEGSLPLRMVREKQSGRLSIDEQNGVKAGEVFVDSINKAIEGKQKELIAGTSWTRELPLPISEPGLKRSVKATFNCKSLRGHQDLIVVIGESEAFALPAPIDKNVLEAPKRRFVEAKIRLRAILRKKDLVPYSAISRFSASYQPDNGPVEKIEIVSSSSLFDFKSWQPVFKEETVPNGFQLHPLRREDRCAIAPPLWTTCATAVQGNMALTMATMSEQGDSNCEPLTLTAAVGIVIFFDGVFEAGTYGASLAYGLSHGMTFSEAADFAERTKVSPLNEILGTLTNGVADALGLSDKTRDYLNRTTQLGFGIFKTFFPGPKLVTKLGKALDYANKFMQSLIHGKDLRQLLRDLGKDLMEWIFGKDWFCTNRPKVDSPADFPPGGPSMGGGRMGGHQGGSPPVILIGPRGGTPPFVGPTAPTVPPTAPTAPPTAPTAPPTAPTMVPTILPTEAPTPTSGAPTPTSRTPTPTLGTPKPPRRDIIFSPTSRRLRLPILPRYRRPMKSDTKPGMEPTRTDEKSAPMKVDEAIAKLESILIELHEKRLQGKEAHDFLRDERNKVESQLVKEYLRFVMSDYLQEPSEIGRKLIKELGSLVRHLRVKQPVVESDVGANWLEAYLRSVHFARLLFLARTGKLPQGPEYAEQLLTNLAESTVLLPLANATTREELRLYLLRALAALRTGDQDVDILATRVDALTKTLQSVGFAGGDTLKGGQSDEQSLLAVDRGAQSAHRPSLWFGKGGQWAALWVDTRRGPPVLCFQKKGEKAVECVPSAVDPKCPVIAGDGVQLMAAFQDRDGPLALPSGSSASGKALSATAIYVSQSSDGGESWASSQKVARGSEPMLIDLGQRWFLFYQRVEGGVALMSREKAYSLKERAAVPREEWNHHSVIGNGPVSGFDVSIKDGGIGFVWNSEGRLLFAESRDKGESWSAARVLAEGNVAGRPAIARGGSLVAYALEDGRIEKRQLKEDGRWITLPPVSSSQGRCFAPNFMEGRGHAAYGGDGPLLTYEVIRDGHQSSVVSKVGDGLSLRVPSYEAANTAALFVPTFSLPWDRSAYLPHDVRFAINGKTVGRLEKAIPEGSYCYPYSPLLAKTSQQRVVRNKLTFDTKHLNGGHYVVSSEWAIGMGKSHSERLLVAHSQQEADRLAVTTKSKGYNDGLVDLAIFSNEVSGLPRKPVKGQSVRLSFIVHNIGAVSANKVRVYVARKEAKSEGANDREAEDNSDGTSIMPMRNYVLLSKTVFIGHVPPGGRRAATVSFIHPGGCFEATLVALSDDKDFRQLNNEWPFMCGWTAEGTLEALVREEVELSIKKQGDEREVLRCSSKESVTLPIGCYEVTALYPKAHKYAPEGTKSFVRKNNVNIRSGKKTTVDLTALFELPSTNQGGSRDHAIEARIDEWTKVELLNDRDWRWFSVALPSAGYLRILTNGMAQGANLEYWFFDENGKSLSKTHESNAIRVREGKYFIGLGIWYKKGTTLPFEVSFSHIPEMDLFEENDSLNSAAPVELGEELPTAIYPRYDKDCFVVEVHKPGLLKVETGGKPSGPITFEYGFYEASTRRELQRSHESNALRVGPGRYIVVVRDYFSTLRYEPLALKLFITFKPSDDQFEENNSVKTASPVRLFQDLDIAIYPRYDVDYFAVDVERKGYLRVETIRAPKEEHTLEYGFYDGVSGKQLQRTHHSNARYVLPGKYIVSIRDYFSTFRKRAMPMTLQLQLDENVDAFEPNDSWKSAKPVALDEKIQLSLYPRYDKDFFRVEVAKKGYVQLKPKMPKGFGLTPEYHFLDDRGKTLQCTHHTNARALFPGTYIVGIRDYFESFRKKPTPFELTIHLVEELDAYEPNNSYKEAKKVELGEDIRSSIYPRYDWDYYVVDVNEAGYLQLNVVKGPKYGLVPEYHFLDDSGKTLQKSHHTNARRVLPGRYVVGLRDYHSVYRQEAEEMMLRIVLIPELDSYEPNDNWHEAKKVQLGNELETTIYPRYESDYYSVDVKEAGYLQLNVVKGPKSGLVPEYHFLDNSGKTLQKSHHTNARRVLPGGYVVGLRDYHSTFRTSPETMSIKVDLLKEIDPYEPNDKKESAVEIELGDVLPIAIYPRYDWDFFKINIPYEGELSVAFTKKPQGYFNFEYLFLDENYRTLKHSHSQNKCKVKKGTSYVGLRDYHSTFRSKPEPMAIKFELIQHTLCEFTFETGTRDEANSNMNVYLKVGGMTREVDDPNRDDFEKGAKDDFTIEWTGLGGKTLNEVLLYVKGDNAWFLKKASFCLQERRVDIQTL